MTETANRTPSPSQRALRSAITAIGVGVLTKRIARQLQLTEDEQTVTRRVIAALELNA